jgi:hypothetical protein
MPRCEKGAKRVSVSCTIAFVILRVCRSLQPVGIDEALRLEALELHDNFQEAGMWEHTKHASVDSTSTSSNLPSRPFSQWQCLTPRGVPTGMQMQMQSRPTPNKIAVAHSITRFQRFIRRMEGAGPKVILDRLKEDWQETMGEEVDDEVCPLI